MPRRHWYHPNSKAINNDDWIPPRGSNIVVAPPPAWTLIDTFTGADGFVLSGTSCDLQPVPSFARYNQYGNSQINGNRAYIAPSGPGLIFYAMGGVPTKIKWDYFNTGNYNDLYFYNSYNYADNFGYFIRINAGTPQLFKRNPISQMSFTTGNTGAGLTAGTCTLDLTPNGFTLTIADVGGTRVLTYSETPMNNNDQVWIGLGSNGGFFDNLYAM